MFWSRPLLFIETTAVMSKRTGSAANAATVRNPYLSIGLDQFGSFLASNGAATLSVMAGETYLSMYTHPYRCRTIGRLGW